MHPPVALTIAGSDSGGGAGIQADLKTFHAFGCFGTSAITAITCQNTRGVSAVQGVEPDIVSGQLNDVLTDFPVRAAKTGMLLSSEIIRAIERVWKALPQGNQIALVVDPVMVASSGDRLLQSDAEEALKAFLSNATLMTPNLPEAEVLLGSSISNLAEARDAANELKKIYGVSVLLKGGHRLSSDDDSVHDVLADDEGLTIFTHPRLSTKNTHGTGCTLSAAIAACLAHELTMRESIKRARAFLAGAMQTAPGLGSGTGPLNHLWNQKPVL